MIDIKSKFNIDLPYGWEDQTVYIFRGPEEGDFQHSLMLAIDRHLSHKDISDFALEKIEPIERSMQNCEVLKKEEITIPGGNPTFEFVYKMILSEDYSNFMKYIFVIKDDLGFTFSAGFTKKTYKTVGAGLKDVIDAILPGTYSPEEED